jgi:hypothetical protein
VCAPTRARVPPAAAGKRKKAAKGGARKKQKKDPNAPKRPLSGYMIFCSEKRDEVKKADSSLTLTGVAKKLGELWRGLSKEEQKPYNDKAAKDKQRYEAEKAAYEKKGKEKPKPAAADDEEEEDEEEDDDDDEDDDD